MKLKRLLGNGMHLVTQATWMMYVLSNTAARESGDAVLRVIFAEASQKALASGSSARLRGAYSVKVSRVSLMNDCAPEDFDLRTLGMLQFQNIDVPETVIVLSQGGASNKTAVTRACKPPFACLSVNCFKPDCPVPIVGMELRPA